ncbi:urease accessory protein UreF [Synechococcus sp. A10-1-5-1]|uniref:urease accessory protein UreF n=1 Tax=Synechococcus sp. A10-1-5-1 TaxID=2936507 RepID=UPI002000AC15|nr:urease accessory UreF family protein [Synechococcus sp. A10-1-5-1]UPM49471.1 urease accessory protein UreF [Synechococcus sp. A10-1-5-1]
MPTPMVSRLRLYQLVSPALPVGAFSYSEGLEVLVQAGQLTSEQSMEDWLTAEVLRGGVAIEAAALAPLMALLRGWRDGAPEAEQELRSLDRWLLVQRESAELRAQQRQMGRSLLQLLADLGWPLPCAGEPLAWPAAYAWACAAMELDSPEVEEAYLYSWVANQLSAAVRLVPLGPTQAQRLQLKLAPLLAKRGQELAAKDPKQQWNGAVGAGMAQLFHAELYSRLFRS